MSKLSINLICACDQNYAIGCSSSGKLPWQLPNEYNYFQSKILTTNDPKRKNAVILGRKTWFDIPMNCRPLKDVVHIILSKTMNKPPTDDVYLCTSYQEALDLLSQSFLQEIVETVWNIGGGEVFKLGLESNSFKKLYLTMIYATFTEADIYFPKVQRDKLKEVTDETDGVPCEIQEENDSGHTGITHGIPCTFVRSLVIHQNVFIWNLSHRAQFLPSALRSAPNMLCYSLNTAVQAQLVQVKSVAKFLLNGFSRQDPITVMAVAEAISSPCSGKLLSASWETKTELSPFIGKGKVGTNHSLDFQMKRWDKQIGNKQGQKENSISFSTSVVNCCRPSKKRKKYRTNDRCYGSMALSESECLDVKHGAEKWLIVLLIVPIVVNVVSSALLLALLIILKRLRNTTSNVSSSVHWLTRVAARVGISPQARTILQSQANQDPKYKQLAPKSK